MVQDIHNKSFTEETKTKLLIFKYYLREWLPVFLSRKEIIWPNINIIDFFAGPGYDTEFNEGSPLIILNELSNYGNTITSKGININVIFNEYKSTKFLKLKENIENKEYNNHINIQLENLDFISAFEKYYQDLCNSASANLLFLDQSGIK